MSRMTPEDLTPGEREWACHIWELLNQAKTRDEMQTAIKALQVAPWRIREAIHNVSDAMLDNNLPPYFHENPFACEQSK